MRVTLVCTTIVLVLVASEIQIDSQDELDFSFIFEAENDKLLRHREKRVVGLVALNSILGTYQRLQSCCSVPGILPNSSLTGCALNIGAVYNPGVRFYGLFRSLQTIYGRRYATNALGYQAYATTTDTSGALVVDTSVLSDVFTSIVDSTWDSVVNNSISACATVANRVPYSVRSSNGSLCSTYPWNLMVCIRRYMLLNCPATSQNVNCGQSLAILNQPRYVYQG